MSRFLVRAYWKDQYHIARLLVHVLYHHWFRRTQSPRVPKTKHYQLADFPFVGSLRRCPCGFCLVACTETLPTTPRCDNPNCYPCDVYPVWVAMARRRDLRDPKLPVCAAVANNRTPISV